MENKNTALHAHLDGVIAAAISGALKDAGLASSLTKVVLDAIDNYEDDLFLRILQESEEGERISIGDIRNALKS
jgi:uncharacterized membrane protein